MAPERERSFDTLTVEFASGDNAHRKLDQQHDRAVIQSHAETRQVKGNYTVPIPA